MTSDYAPCHRSKNIAFNNPEAASEQSRRAAIEVCHHCPLIVACAAAGLEAGNTLDHVKQPANGVIQAGVICHGDSVTKMILAHIAGVPLVEDKQRKPRKGRAASKCVNCSQLMVPWTRDVVPDGYVMHHARNYCTECRSAYGAVRAGTESRHVGLRKKPNRRSRRAAELVA